MFTFYKFTFHISWRKSNELKVYLNQIIIRDELIKRVWAEARAYYSLLNPFIKQLQQGTSVTS